MTIVATLKRTVRKSMTGIRLMVSCTTRNVPPHTAVMPTSAANARLGRDFQFANIYAPFPGQDPVCSTSIRKIGFIIVAGFNLAWLPPLERIKSAALVAIWAVTGIFKILKYKVNKSLQKVYSMLQLRENNLRKDL